MKAGDPCPKCGSQYMYYNFHKVLICRNCGYQPTCPKCERFYQCDDMYDDDSGYTHKFIGDRTDLRKFQEQQYNLEQCIRSIEWELSKSSRNKYISKYNMERHLQQHIKKLRKTFDLEKQPEEPEQTTLNVDWM